MSKIDSGKPIDESAPLLPNNPSIEEMEVIVNPEVYYDRIHNSSRSNKPLFSMVLLALGSTAMLILGARLDPLYFVGAGGGLLAFTTLLIKKGEKDKLYEKLNDLRDSFQSDPEYQKYQEDIDSIRDLMFQDRPSNFTVQRISGGISELSEKYLMKETFAKEMRAFMKVYKEHTE